MNSLKSLLKALEELPWIVKLILCIPALNIVWAVYRIVKGIVCKDVVTLVIGIIWILGAFSIGWLIDLICVIWKKDIFSLKLFN